jgi:hypothetical protein
LSYRSGVVSGENAAMTVSGFYRRPVEYEDDEQQTEPTLQHGGLMPKSSDQYAGHACDMLESGSFEIVQRPNHKTPFSSLCG